MSITIKTTEQAGYMRKAGRIVGEALNLIEKSIRVGITTKELDTIAQQYIESKGAKPSFKGYGGFPSTICASINEEVIHGIPSNRALCEGDIISIDVGANIYGFHGDAARTFTVGEVSSEAKKLIDVTKQSFFEGIKYAISGNYLHDISLAIQEYVEANGFSIVRDYVGHGIGKNLHEAPEIPNYKPLGKGPLLKAGMALAIEPMVNIGDFDVNVLKDRWTVVTADKTLSAHYENSILITENEPEILTLV